MGLLDEAIRDHLELKRRRGADPGEVAREQREVLDAGPEARAEAPTGEEPSAPSVADEHEPPVPDSSAELGVLDRETAELDMSTILADDVDAGPPVTEEDSLTWEIPERRGGPPADEASSRAGLE